MGPRLSFSHHSQWSKAYIHFGDLTAHCKSNFHYIIKHNDSEQVHLSLHGELVNLSVARPEESSSEVDTVQPEETPRHDGSENLVLECVSSDDIPGAAMGSNTVEAEKSKDIEGECPNCSHSNSVIEKLMEEVTVKDDQLKKMSEELVTAQKTLEINRLKQQDLELDKGRLELLREKTSKESDEKINKVNIEKLEIEDRLIKMVREKQAILEKDKNVMNMFKFLKTHEGDKQTDNNSFNTNEPQKCGLCDKVFSNIRTHMEHLFSAHLKQNQYQCDNCAYQASTVQDLESHLIQIHDGVLPKCDECGHTFTFEVELNNHMMKSHDVRGRDQYQYQCKHCAYQAITIQDLKRHLEQIHDDVLLKCEECGLTFTWAAELNNHMLKSHGIRVKEYQTKPLDLSNNQRVVNSNSN